MRLAMTNARCAQGLSRSFPLSKHKATVTSGLAPSIRSRSAAICMATSPTSEKLQQGALANKSTKRPPIYRVMLHNDNYNKREYVVKVLIKVVEGMGVDDAIAVMKEAHETGVAMVQACPQDEAEQCCECLRLSGLSSSIEPGC